MSRSQRGFTLIELVLVMLIVGIALAVVGPSIGNRLERGNPTRTAHQLRATMDFLRLRAVQDGEPAVLVVAPRSNSYWREQPTENHSDAPRPESADAVVIPPGGGFLSARGAWTRDDDAVEFRFYPDGTNSGGEVRIGHTSSPAAAGFVVELNPLLGTATIRHEK